MPTYPPRPPPSTQPSEYPASDDPTRLPATPPRNPKVIDLDLESEVEGVIPQMQQEDWETWKALNSSELLRSARSAGPTESPNKQQKMNREDDGDAAGVRPGGELVARTDAEEGAEQEAAEARPAGQEGEIGGRARDEGSSQKRVPHTPKRGTRVRFNMKFDKEGFLGEPVEDTNDNHLGDTEPFVQDAQEPEGEEEQERTMTSGDAVDSAGAQLPGTATEEGDAGGEEDDAG